MSGSMQGENRKKRSRHIRGLRERWIINTVMPVFLLVIFIVALASMGIATYYYQGMRTGLENRAQAASDSFNSYFMNSYPEYYQKAVSYADNFEDKDYIELQFISGSGRVQVSSSNLTAGSSPGTDDISAALSQGIMASFRGMDPQTG